jgi:hypothetical protein
VLGSLGYLVVRPLFELMVLCSRSPRSKELEILVLQHELSISDATCTARDSARRTGCYQRRCVAHSLGTPGRPSREGCQNPVQRGIRVLTPFKVEAAGAAADEREPRAGAEGAPVRGPWRTRLVDRGRAASERQQRLGKRRKGASADPPRPSGALTPDTPRADQPYLVPARARVNSY